MSTARSISIFLTARVLACAALGCAVAGCVSFPHESSFAFGPVDPNSSVATAVAAASESPGRYPNLHKIPPNPTDVRPAADWKTAVVAELAVKQQVETQAAAIPFTLDNTQPFAAQAHARIAPDLAVQAPAGAAAEAQAFAESARARATPPPKPN